MDHAQITPRVPKSGYSVLVSYCFRNMALNKYDRVKHYDGCAMDKRIVNLLLTNELSIILLSNNCQLLSSTFSQS